MDHRCDQKHLLRYLGALVSWNRGYCSEKPTSCREGNDGITEDVNVGQKVALLLFRELRTSVCLLRMLLSGNQNPPII